MSAPTDHQTLTARVLATRRLRASGEAPLVNELPVVGDLARRTAAARLFPIWPHDFRLLERTVLKVVSTPTVPAEIHS